MLARTILTVAVTAALAAFAAGCGGGDDAGSAAQNTGSTSSNAGNASSSEAPAGPEGAPGGELTKAELIEQGDAICERGRTKAEAEIGRKLKSNASKAEASEVIISVSLPAIQAQTEEMGALDAPSGDEAEIEAIVQSVKDAVAAAEKNPSLLSEKGSPFVKADKLATQYGFKACGQI